MADRRSLTEGLQETPAELKQAEREFVFGGKPKSKAKAPSDNVLPQYRSRAPLTTRVRPELASALKRASLTRQLEARTPYHVQEIMEEALEHWLASNGYPTD